MDKNLQRNDENFLSYAKRLINNKELYDLDYVEIYELLFGIKLSSCEARKRLYGVKAFLEQIDENITDSTILDKIKLEKQEIQKEKYKIQTEKLELNRWLREQARWELFEEKMIKAMKHYCNTKIPKIQIKKQQNNIAALSMFADTHYGTEILIKGLQGEILNEYNIDIFEKRMWKLLQEIVVNLEKNNLKHTYLVNLSDSIDGILRISQLQSLKLGIVESVIGFSDFLAKWLNELSNYTYVDYFAVEGNHNEIRPLGSKKGEFPHENTEKLITKFLYYILQDNPNININFTNSNFAYFEILNKYILATHGQNEKDLEKSLKDYILFYNKPIDILLTGHLHSAHEKTIGMTETGEIEFIQCPSIVGIDEYSVNLKKSSKPGSKFILFEYGKGRTTTNILLDER